MALSGLVLLGSHLCVRKRDSGFWYYPTGVPVRGTMRPQTVSAPKLAVASETSWLTRRWQKLYAPERKEQESYKTHRCINTPDDKTLGVPEDQGARKWLSISLPKKQLCNTCFEPFVQVVWVLGIIFRKIHLQTQKLHSYPLHSLSLRMIANDKNRLPRVFELFYIHTCIFGNWVLHKRFWDKGIVSGLWHIMYRW